MKYYKVDMLNAEIEEIEVDSVTKNHVSINGNSFPKENVGSIYRPTREESKEILVQYFEGIRDGLEIRLKFTNDKIEKAKRL